MNFTESAFISNATKMLSGSGRILRARGRLTSVQQETKAELVINLKTAKRSASKCR